ncbi:MAG: hypothetical protein ABIQ35_03625 [Verrucomicrobiota bacterium]
MKIKFLVSFAALTVSIFLTGCVSTVDGHMKMGMPLVKDKIDSRYPRSIPQLIAAAKVVLARNGTLVSDDTINNTVTARVDTRTVWVKVTEVDANVSGMTVQARTKGGAPDVDLASEIDKQIALNLATNQ